MCREIILERNQEFGAKLTSDFPFPVDLFNQPVGKVSKHTDYGLDFMFICGMYTYKRIEKRSVKISSVSSARHQARGESFFRSF